MNIDTTNYGDVFICDLCNSECPPEYDEDDVLTNGGGVVIGSYAAYCPDCANKYGYYDKEGNPSYVKLQEDIDAGYLRKEDIVWFNKAKPFADNGRDFRNRRYGTPDLISQIVTFDKGENMFDYLAKATKIKGEK